MASWKLVASYVLWRKANEFGCRWVRGDFKSSACVRGLTRTTPDSSLLSCMCVIDCSCSYPSRISSSVCPCWLLSVCDCCLWCETAFVQSIKFNRVIALFPSCENTSKLNRYSMYNCCCPSLWNKRSVQINTALAKSHERSISASPHTNGCVLLTDRILLISHVNICLGLHPINSKGNAKHLRHSHCCRGMKHLKTTRLTITHQNAAFIYPDSINGASVSCAGLYGTSREVSVVIIVFYEKENNAYCFQKEILILGLLKGSVYSCELHNWISNLWNNWRFCVKLDPIRAGTRTWGHKHNPTHLVNQLYSSHVQPG